MPLSFFKSMKILFSFEQMHTGLDHGCRPDEEPDGPHEDKFMREMLNNISISSKYKSEL